MLYGKPKKKIISPSASKWGLDADLYQGVRVLVNFDIESKESWQEI